jgi:hypothetical protein
MNAAATVAALCIFNGLGLSPVNASPSHRFKLAGPAVSPRFEQIERYMNRYFPEPGSASVKDYMPLEVFDGHMAFAPWLRGAVGTLQYSLKREHGITIPDAHGIDPARFFDDLEGLALLYIEHAKPQDWYFIKNLARNVEAMWTEDEETATNPNSQQAYVQKLYAICHAMQERDQLLTSSPGIIRARNANPPKEGQKYPI